MDRWDGPPGEGKTDSGVPLHVFHSPDCLKKEINLKNTFRRGSIFGFEINVYGPNIWVVGGFGEAVQS